MARTSASKSIDTDSVDLFGVVMAKNALKYFKMLLEYVMSA